MEDTQQLTRPTTAGELIYRIDAQDRIIFVNEQWDRFALENSPRERQDVLAPDQVIGRSLWDFISDRTTREIYHTLIQRVRRRDAIRFSFRCDGPACRRLLQMDIAEGPDDTIEFHTLTLETETRAPQLLLDADMLRNTGTLLLMCGWCNRFHTEHGWLEVEDAVVQLGLFDLPRLPQLSHGVCDECYAGLRATLENRATHRPAAVSISLPKTNS